MIDNNDCHYWLFYKLSHFGNLIEMIFDLFKIVYS